ncbi:MAG: hypothetical protein RLZZ324_19, partial [Candidatus Parcubacteria bacterium]
MDSKKDAKKPAAKPGAKRPYVSTPRRAVGASRSDSKPAPRPPQPHERGKIPVVRTNMTPPSPRVTPISVTERGALAPRKPAAPKPGVGHALRGAPVPTSWGSVASWYDRLLGGEAGTFQKEVILPGLLRLMQIAPGQRIADLACGQGFFSGAFKNAGAEVVAADISPELIERAKKNAPGVEFHVAPATAVPQIASESVDQATIILAIQNIEDARGALAECARVLKVGGRLHVVMNHPAFRIPKRSSWGWDKDNKQYRRVDAYLTESRAA